MKAGLKEINELAGVWGSLVINNQGEIIANVLPPGLNKTAQENITKHILKLLVSAGESLSDIFEMVFHYSQRIVFVQDLKQAILIVICTPSVDISLLRMAVNVVVTNWGADQKVQKQLKAHNVERV